MRFWPDGLLEYGWLQAPAVRRPAPAWNRLIPTHAIPEYVHDFLVLSAAVFAGLGYHDAVVARARLNNVAGYRLAVEPSRFLETTELGEDMVESRRWQGPAGELVDGARKVAHDISDRLFIAGGVSGGAYFFDDEGSYTGRR